MEITIPFEEMTEEQARAAFGRILAEIEEIQGRMRVTDANITYLKERSERLKIETAG